MTDLDAGMWFEERFCCGGCEHYVMDPELGFHDCRLGILVRAIAHPVADPDYPSEWICDEDGSNPRCTAFRAKATDEVIERETS